jgi:hypothetical protein
LAAALISVGALSLTWTAELASVCAMYALSATRVAACAY